MKRLVSFFATLVVPALLFAGIGANQAMAQEKAKAGPPKVVLTVLLENDKVRVYDAQFAPGAETGSMARPARVVHVLAGGTLERIYPDGKKDSLTYKTGDVKFFDATPAYIVKNAGKSKVHLYVVNLK